MRATKLLSGSDTRGLKQIDKQPADFAAVDLAEDFVGIDAGLRQFVRIDAPHLGDVRRDAPGWPCRARREAGRIFGHARVRPGHWPGR